MGIKLTEAQFEEMLNGTVHEGKYAPQKPKAKPRPKSRSTSSNDGSRTATKRSTTKHSTTKRATTKRKPTAKRPSSTANGKPKRNLHQESFHQTEMLSKDIRKALPWMLGANILTQPLFWAIAALLLLIGMSVVGSILGPVFTLVGRIFGL